MAEQTASGTVRRAVGTLLIGTAVAATCVLLGVWQWNRHVARSEAVAVFESWSQAPATPIGTALGAGPVTTPQVWQPVSATGHYLCDAQILLRNRPVDGQAGYHVLVPFVVDFGPLAGSALLVDRGFVARGADAAVLPPIPVAPDGTVDLVVRLRIEEAPSGRETIEGQVQSISTLDAQTAAPVAWDAPPLAGYGQAVSENGLRPVGLVPTQQPSTDLGPHLSYAFQWWVFAAGALIGAVILVRRDARHGEERPTRRLGPDEQAEDALLDERGQAS